MACNLISSPFHETSAFEEDWQKAVGVSSDVGGLDLIADFNAACDNNATAFDSSAAPGNGIDPQLLNSAAPSPDQSSDIFDQGFSHNDFSYPDFNQPTPVNTPYFHSMEAPFATPAPMFAASPLRNQLHRRSVSEPPDAFPHHHHHLESHFLPAGPTMTLTRDGHYLGQPKPQNHGPRLMKSLPKNKPYRSQPYAVKGSPQRSNADRYNFRNPRPQPVHAHTIGPTSMPRAPYMASPPPPSQHPMQGACTTSRVCTPAPSPVHDTMAASPVAINPTLRTVTPEKKFVSIPVDELRMLITEAVKKAVDGTEAARKNEGGGLVDGAADAGGENGDEDEIVVASVEGRDGEPDESQVKT